MRRPALRCLGGVTADVCMRWNVRWRSGCSQRVPGACPSLYYRRALDLFDLQCGTFPTCTDIVPWLHIRSHSMIVSCLIAMLCANQRTCSSAQGGARIASGGRRRGGQAVGHRGLEPAHARLHRRHLLWHRDALCRHHLARFQGATNPQPAAALHAAVPGPAGPQMMGCRASYIHLNTLAARLLR